MKAIVAVDLNWGIGHNKDMLEWIPEDLAYFKEKTIGNVVVMGRETYESLPGKAPLVDRLNVVLTRNESFKDDRVIITHSVEETLEKLKDYDSDRIFITGGAAIYKEFLHLCDEVLVTKINKEHIADRFFPNLDEDPNHWILVSRGENKEHEGIPFNFNIYQRK